MANIHIQRIYKEINGLQYKIKIALWNRMQLQYSGIYALMALIINFLANIIWPIIRIMLFCIQDN
jgi:hypothetical protein